jgi:hypothetical protein
VAAAVSTPDYVVLRHGLDVPEEYRSARHEGLWLDRRDVPVGPSAGGDRCAADPAVGQAVAEPTGRFEARDDGAVAEVWEIRLRTPNERRRAAEG